MNAVENALCAALGISCRPAGTHIRAVSHRFMSAHDAMNALLAGLALSSDDDERAQVVKRWLLHRNAEHFEVHT